MPSLQFQNGSIPFLKFEICNLKSLIKFAFNFIKCTGDILGGFFFKKNVDIFLYIFFEEQRVEMFIRVGYSMIRLGWPVNFYNFKSDLPNPAKWSLLLED